MSLERDRERLTLLLSALADPSVASRLPAGDARLLELARHHRLTPLLSAEQGAALPASLAEAVRRDRVVTTARSMVLSQVAEECLGALAAARVDTMVLKGLDYENRLYPAPGSRPTSDVDLLVPAETRRTAFQVLDRLGFEPRAAAPGFDDPDYHEVAWTRGGVEVDLHMALAPIARCRIDYAAVWRQAEPLRVGQTDTRALARPHAAIFHALHMAIDHFAVPAIYLVDLARLVPTAAEQDAAGALAAEWHCRRPYDTALALANAFLPARGGAGARGPSAIGRRVLARYGDTSPLPRPEQLLRKLLHFDAVSDVARYVSVQSRRNLRELAERRWRHRTARERLGLASSSR
jgi:hypothetical protein